MQISVLIAWVALVIVQCNATPSPIILGEGKALAIAKNNQKCLLKWDKKL